jgi:hypothetical protein
MELLFSPQLLIVEISTSAEIYEISFDFHTIEMLNWK